MFSRVSAAALACVAVALIDTATDAQRVTGDTASAMSRVAGYVERYYSRAQSIVAVETVTVQNVTRDLVADGFARRFVYNLRVEWSPAAAGPPTANVSRELISVNGRPPKAGDEPHCTAPKPITPEPLAMFMRDNQRDFIFGNPDRVTLDGRRSLRLDYRIRQPEPDQVDWDRDCVTMNFPSRLRGRVWLDEESGEVLRLDEGANGPVEVRAPAQQERRGAPQVVVFDRWNVSIRYRPVTFADPDETILLPASIEALSMARTTGTRRTQSYSDYRRFVTGGRIVD